MRFAVDGAGIVITCPHGGVVRWEGVAAAEKWMGRTAAIYVRCECAVEDNETYVTEQEVRDLHERAMASPKLARCYAIVSEGKHA